jgi:excisionase family DNA binding protein
MFAPMTKASILAIARLDQGVSRDERDALIRVVSGVRQLDPMLRYRDAAARLNVSLATVRRLVKSGKLKTVAGSGSRNIGVTAESVRLAAQG